MEHPVPPAPRRRTDPDPPATARRQSSIDHQAPPVAAIAVGGALGAVARYAVGLAWPTPDGRFPTSTLLINVIGCAVMGALMVLITEKWEAPPLVRPFFGTGVLGGFTTFSTYEVDAQQLLQNGHVVTAAAYLVLTVLAALAAVWAAAGITRFMVVRSTGDSA